MFYGWFVFALKINFITLFGCYSTTLTTHTTQLHKLGTGNLNCYHHTCDRGDGCQ